MLGIQAVPSVAFFLLLLLHAREPPLAHRPGPRSRRPGPSWRGWASTACGIEQEVAEIQASLDLEHHTQAASSLFQAASIAGRSCWPWRSPMFNQLSGINALMYYAPTIFKMAGAGADSALLQAVAVGGTNLVFTMLAMAVIDHFGRRKLILIGSIGYIISLGDHGLGLLLLRHGIHAGRARAVVLAGL